MDDAEEGPPTTVAELKRSATRTANKLDLMLEIVLEYLEKTYACAHRRPRLACLFVWSRF